MTTPRLGPTTPVVTTLLTTPVKGFMVQPRRRVRLDKNGAVGDRDFFVIDTSNRLLSVTRTGVFIGYRADFDETTSTLTVTTPDDRVLAEQVVPADPVTVDFWESRDVTGHVVAGPWSTWLSDIARQPVQLIRADEPGSGSDEAAVTVVSEQSVDEVARSAGSGDIDIRRFRMLVNISGVAPYEEESWHGRMVQVGSAVLRMRGPVPRCTATARHPESGERDLKTLQLLKRARGVQPNEFGSGLNLGAYASIVEPGSVSVGDALELS